MFKFIFIMYHYQHLPSHGRRGGGGGGGYSGDTRRTNIMGLWIMDCCSSNGMECLSDSTSRGGNIGSDIGVART